MSRSIEKSILLFSLVLSIFEIQIRGNDIQEEEILNTDKPRKFSFNYRDNGIKIDIRTISIVNDTLQFSRTHNDSFPQIPISEIAHCLNGLSLNCVYKRIVHFLETVRHLPQITLFGDSVKLVKLKELQSDNEEKPRGLIGISKTIDSSINDFFDTFGLRITLPKWKGKKNQIDIMMNDINPVEGRSGKGGGKGGSKGGKGGKGGGCKKMMMMMMIGLKMKMMGMIGMAAMKGMFMSGMSLMISKMMLLQQLMNKKGGIFGGFSGGNSYGGGNQGQLKEIVLLTKSTGGAGGGSSCSGASGCSPGGGSYVQDNYGAPPPSSMVSSGGYDYSGGGGGGGGWGRSFNEQPLSFVKDYIFRKHDRKPIVALSENVLNTSIPVRSTVNKRSKEPAWNYTKELKNSNETKIIKNMKKHNINDIKPVYAIEWKNYELV